MTYIRTCPICYKTFATPEKRDQHYYQGHTEAERKELSEKLAHETSVLLERNKRI